MNLDCLTFCLWAPGFSSEIKSENEHFWSTELLAGPKTVGAVYERIFPCKVRVPPGTPWYCIWQRLFDIPSRKHQEMLSARQAVLSTVVVGASDMYIGPTNRANFGRGVGVKISAALCDDMLRVCERCGQRRWAVGVRLLA